MIYNCIHCKLDKDASEFNNSKAKKSGKSSRCKDCERAKAQKKYWENIAKTREKANRYRSKNRIQARQYARKRYQLKKEEIKEYERQRRKNKPEVMREYRIKNKERIKQATKIYRQRRSKTDPAYKIRNNLKTRIWESLKGIRKSKKTIELLGCSIFKFKLYLEAQFWKDDRIDWCTYGHKGWHIDHIRPCASFDLSDPEQQKQCFHYTNTQPLWCTENIRKKDKYEP